MSFTQLAAAAQDWVAAAAADPHAPAQIPNPPPSPPPGSGAIEQIVGYLRWVAGISVLGLFFGGLIAATAGRLWDHHGSGRLGARMIVGSLALALLFGLGYTLVSQFARTSLMALGECPQRR